MRPPTRQQQQAIAARGNVLVAAGAGTGKTSTLVARCLALLDAGASLENILMVTFTDAAALEMRGRIRQALQEKVRALDTDASAGAARREHFQKQLALLDAAFISTLHSLCLQLVREHFYELGLDPDFFVLDEQQTEPLIRQTLDALFERHYGGAADADRAVQQLVRAQGRGSDERIRALVLKLHRYSQSLAAPQAWLAAQQEMFAQAEPTRWREWLPAEIRGWRDKWLPQLAGFFANPAVALAMAALRNVPAQATPEQILQAAKAIQTADRDKGNWPRGSIKNVRDPLKEFFDEADFLASLAPSPEANPLAEDWEWIRHDMLALLALTGAFTAEFSRAKREAGGVDFADLEQFALCVLRQPGSGAPSATALQWRRRLEHVFVDEYQDINAAQDKIIEALSRGDVPDSEFRVPGQTAAPPETRNPELKTQSPKPEIVAGNRFLVGDVKQSIYRFRLADPAIFRGYESRWSRGDNGAQRLPLSENFRSRPGVLDFVNALFRPLMRQDVWGVAYEDLVFGDATGRAARANDGGGAPRVELHFIARTGGENGDETDADACPENSELADLPAIEREARLVALRLRRLKASGHAVWDAGERRFRPATWSDMAVLLRSPRGRVEAFAKEFAAAGVPLEAARGGFFESLEVSDLVCLLKLLDNPMQDIPLLAVLRSPLVAMSLPELAEVRARESGGHAEDFWLATRNFLARGERSDSAWRKLKRFSEQLGRWRELIRHTSLSHCLETALVETHYEPLLRAGPRGEARAANVRRLLALAREYDPFQRQGLFRFLRFVRAQEEREVELEAAPTGEDAVRLLSIHKSKGLEFPVVALACLGARFNVRDLNDGVLLDETFGLCPKITPPEAERSYPSLSHWLARRRQRRELLGEELRLLYVALTRARDTLLLAGTLPGRADPKWASAPARELSDDELLSARSHLDWLKLWLPQATRDDDWRSGRDGESGLFRWTIYLEDDARLAAPASASGGSSELRPDPSPLAPSLPASAGPETNVAPQIAPAEISELAARLNWLYPFRAATLQKAKTSVTELRRGRDEEEAEPARFARRTVFAGARPGARGLSAAEIGTAHHRFLQRVGLDRTGGIEELRGEAGRLVREQWLSGEEAAALDFAALAQFWQSDFGRHAARHPSSVRRELQFTARFSARELADLNLEPPAEVSADDFVVVQGMVDLAVILPDEIRLVDFKTDAVGEGELPAKVRHYEPQVRLYARALAGIYRRPVTDCRLHFLARQTTVRI